MRLTLKSLEVPPLQPVSLTVEGGECVGLSGVSGSGKSRMLRAIADLDPAVGEVTLDGASREAIPAPQWRRRVTLVPAESHWWADRLGAHFPKLPDPGEFDALGLPALDPGTDPAELSSGERQRLALLRAVLPGPACLLLDEPTANLDEDSTARVERWLAAHRERGMALIWVSHDPAQIARVAQCAYRLEAGVLEPAA